MTKARNVKNAAAALAPPASAADRLPTTARRGEQLTMADALRNEQSGLGTWRDKRSFSSYGFVGPLGDQQLRAMFRKSWLANAIVTIPVEDMIREGITVKWDGITKDDAAIIKRAERKFRLKSVQHEGLTWGRLFGGAAVIPIIDGHAFDQPLDMASIRKGSLRGFMVWDRTWVIPQGGAPDRDFNSPNYGKPLFYRVRHSSVEVHWSRVFRFEGRLIDYDDFLANNFWHDSELRHVVTSMTDYDGSKENVASMLWEAKLDVIKTSLAKMIAMKDGGASVEKRYRDAALGKSNHRLLLINNDEEYDSKVLQFGGLDNVLGFFAIDACGAARIPMVKLFGQSAPGMNSTGDNDVRLYYDRVSGEDERVRLPPLTLMYEVMIRSELDRLPEGFEICPNPMWQLSAKDLAAIQFQRAQADALYEKIGLPIAAIFKRLRDEGTYDLSDDDIKMAEELDAAIPDEQDEPATLPPSNSNQPPPPNPDDEPAV
jgi:phage-related protein (TIGR01555 family)